MQQLEALTREARELAASGACADTATNAGATQPALREQVIRFAPQTMTAHESEVARQMQICNACRYCEGFCAVFPAMTKRLSFAKADVNYLANLCHNCGACYHACQYAPPHEFAVNVPKAMAQVRMDTYTEYAWPRAFGALYKRNGLTVAFALALGLALFIALGAVLGGPAVGRTFNSAIPGGNFYAIFPHNVLATLFGAVFLFAMLALGVGVTRFLRDVSTGDATPGALAEAAHDALTLKYLDGGHGEGCNEADDRFTLARRRFHHLTFYGFMLCFAATAVATLYHYAFGLEAPYPLLSAPVLLGTVGGVSLLAGASGLLWLNLHRDPARTDLRQRPMDRAFIALLIMTSASGLALLALRDTAAMAGLLAVHLGAVMALFATMPYGKFAHGIFRSAALVKAAIERRTAKAPATASD